MISRKEITDLRILRIVEAIKRDPCTSIRPLADRINLSPSRLQHLFLAETGVSLGTHISDMRLEKAARLLRTTYKQIKEISYDVGYNHPSSFARAFKSRYAVAPAQYRTPRCPGATFGTHHPRAFV